MYLYILLIKSKCLAVFLPQFMDYCKGHKYVNPFATFLKWNLRSQYIHSQNNISKEIPLKLLKLRGRGTFYRHIYSFSMEERILRSQILMKWNRDKYWCVNIILYSDDTKSIVEIISNRQMLLNALVHIVKDKPFYQDLDNFPAATLSQRACIWLCIRAYCLIHILDLNKTHLH